MSRARGDGLAAEGADVFGNTGESIRRGLSRSPDSGVGMNSWGKPKIDFFLVTLGCTGAFPEVDSNQCDVGVGGRDRGWIFSRGGGTKGDIVGRVLLPFGVAMLGVDVEGTKLGGVCG